MRDAFDLTSAVSDSEFAALMTRIPLMAMGNRLGIAVSGGSDSMALTLLLSRWAKVRDKAVFTVTVDHQLRSESSAEAAWVQARLSDEGISHDILPWTNKVAGRGSLQVQARKARYEMLSRWCHEKEIRFLALAHHQDDQLETLLLRLQKHSGPDGLAGMSLLRREADVMLIRPLLSASKARLVATLKDRGWGWIEEASNYKDDYARNRLRRAMPFLEQQGIRPETLTRIVRSLGRIRRNLQSRTDHFIDQHVVLHPEGYLSVDLSDSAVIDEELFCRALVRGLLTVGGGSYSPRTAQIQKLVQDLLGRQKDRASLGGCYLSVTNDRLFVVRENRNIEDCTLEEGEFLWDNRFHVFVDANPSVKGMLLKALGRRGWQQLSEIFPEAKKSAIPLAGRYSLPAVFSGDKVIFVPHLDYSHADCRGQQSIKMRFEPKNILFSPPFTVA
ncbi:tRNA lysidine(34) synthetase TilS [Kiloniella laminariae]|uniref:tRNA(Ile)-lysidine synthase n=1 Tax=Kiloniella laminariae TaxID=454162 RepID=A0ABT4LI89_9PROT|nr:tRNA lysidine(34) synthetase TilS [Kiloniella laminariae]MCZ4280806.1 tRNA lysidine(34) synthetase TilS [Kiloniella laminariae]